jgi:hypothetical protein
MTYQTWVFLHIAAGTLALVAFWAAAVLRKGSTGHRYVGRAYLLAMLAIIVSGVPLTLQRLADGHVITGAFLGYLLVIVAAGVWSAWRAVRDKHDPVAYTGPVYLALGAASLLAGLAVLVLGIRHGQPLLMGFSVVGLFGGQDMLRKRRRIVGKPLWWREEHYGAMVGNGVATHIAFLAIGLPRLFPGISGSALFYAAWFGPLVVAVIARVLLARKYRVPASRPTSPVAAPQSAAV